MRHLSEAELIDLAEGTLAEHEQPHVAECEACRTQVRDLRAMMSAAADVGVPEPSPLFWEHFSNRVRAAVAVEPRRVPVWRQPWWRLAVPVAALAALVLAAVVTLRYPSGVPEQPPAQQSASEAPLEVREPVSLSNDPSLNLIAELAGDLDLDAVVEAGLATSDGALDRLLSELSADERLELQRMLKQEMSRQGA